MLDNEIDGDFQDLIASDVENNDNDTDMNDSSNDYLMSDSESDPEILSCEEMDDDDHSSGCLKKRKKMKYERNCSLRKRGRPRKYSNNTSFIKQNEKQSEDEQSSSDHRLSIENDKSLSISLNTNSSSIHFASMVMNDDTLHNNIAYHVRCETIYSLSILSLICILCGCMSLHERKCMICHPLLFLYYLVQQMIKCSILMIVVMMMDIKQQLNQQKENHWRCQPLLHILHRKRMFIHIYIVLCMHVCAMNDRYLQSFAPMIYESNVAQITYQPLFINSPSTIYHNMQYPVFVQSLAVDHSPISSLSSTPAMVDDTCDSILHQSQNINNDEYFLSRGSLSPQYSSLNSFEANFVENSPPPPFSFFNDFDFGSNSDNIDMYDGLMKQSSDCSLKFLSSMMNDENQMQMDDYTSQLLSFLPNLDCSAFEVDGGSDDVF